MRTILVIVVAISLVACTAASEPESHTVVMSPEPPTPADPVTPDVPVPHHALGGGLPGEQSPGDAYGSKWPGSDPDACATARFTIPGGFGGRFVQDMQTGQQWGATEAIAVSEGAATDIDATYANQMCNAQFPGTRAATAAELASLRAVVPGCPLPGAFYAVDLYIMTTSDARCIDLLSGVEYTATACSVVRDHSKTPSTPYDIARAALCVK